MTRLRVDLGLRTWAPSLSLSIFCLSAFLVPLHSLYSLGAKPLGIQKLWGAGLIRKQERSSSHGLCLLPEEGDQGLGSQLSLSPNSPTEVGSYGGEMSSEKWLYSCCFCLELKIAFYLPMSKSGPSMTESWRRLMAAGAGGGGQDTCVPRMGNRRLPIRGRQELGEHSL